MKSISIHGIDRETDNAIKERAKSESKSVNKVVREIIEKSLGLRGSKPDRDNQAEFSDLSGVWTPAETEQFLASLADFEIVDPRDWR
jgi:hypothetical protein